MLTYLKYLIQILLSPANGWEDIERDGDQCADVRLRSHGFIPLTLVAALSVFLSLFYNPATPILGLILKAIVVFLAVFVGCYLALFLMSIYMPAASRDYDYDPQRGAVFVMSVLGLCDIAVILASAAPMLIALVMFFPFYLVVVIFKGARFMRVRDGYMKTFLLVAVFGTVLFPLALYILFNLLLPS